MDSLNLPVDVAEHASYISSRDLRLGHLIPEGHTLASAADEGALDAAELEAAVTAVRYLAGQTIEESVSSLLSAAYEASSRKAPTDEWLTALQARYGVLGGAPTSLDEASKFVGVTRERVRQVTSRMASHLRGCWVPALVPALRAAVDGSPLPEPVGETLAPLGLSKPTLPGVSLLKVVELVGLDVQAAVGTSLEVSDGWLLDVRERDVLGAVQVASRHTSKYGMTTVENIRQELSTSTNPAQTRDVEVVLGSDPRVRWAGAWLWIDKPCVSEHDNSMVNTIRHILSVNSPQAVASLQEGLRRNQKFRQRDVVPPVEAMAAFIDASEHFTLAGDLVSAVEDLDYHEVLGPVAASMVDVLKASRWQVMDRTSMMQAFEDAGIASGTAGVWTTYSEWMENFATNVWGLRGATPSAGVVAEIRADAKARSASEPRRTRWGWTQAGTVELLVDVSTPVRQSGTVSFGQNIGQTLGDQRLPVYVNGTQAGELKISAAHVWTWGWGPAIAATGAKVGDVLRMELDLAAGSAVAVLGNQDMWLG